MSEVDVAGTVRDRWEAGDCPCCGGSFQVWDERPVAEGVRLCGRCFDRGHYAGPDLARLLGMLGPDRSVHLERSGDTP